MEGKSLLIEGMNNQLAVHETHLYNGHTSIDVNKCLKFVFEDIIASTQWCHFDCMPPWSKQNIWLKIAWFETSYVLLKPMHRINPKTKQKKAFQIHFKLLLVVLLNTVHLMRLRSPILSA